MTTQTQSVRQQRAKIILCALAILAGSLPLHFARAAGPVRVHLRPLAGPDGRTVEVRAPAGGVAVLVFYSTECPISNAYSPILNRLAAAFPPEKVRLVGLCVDPDLSGAEILAHVKDFELTFPVARDPDGSVARRLGATISPEAFVIDDQGRIRYHGRIDDQFAARQKRNEQAQSHDLSDAIAAVLAGKEVPAPFLPAIGCPLPEPNPAQLRPTFARDVAPILQRHCQECHRKGQVGPFPLETYEQVRKRATDLANAVWDRRMPPWKPAPGVGPKFKHDRSLAPGEIAVLTAWAATGAPEGDPDDLPPPAEFADEWALGTPDLVVELPESYEVPAEGSDIYRCFVIPTNLPHDQYIAAIEYRPGNRRVVHHILSYTDTTGAGRKRDEADPGPGYACFSGPGVEIHGDLGGWAPGNEPSRLPDGIGRLLPRKADVIMQVHYHPTGRTEADRSRIGLYFATRPVQQVLHWSAAINTNFQIPPGAERHTVEADWKVPADLVAWAVTPHMHLLGHDMLISVEYPDHHSQDLIAISDWDFGWQNTYWFEQPIDLPKDSVVRVLAHFDNSEKNPRNPNHPPRPVKFGEATTDEMCIGFLAVTLKGQDLTQPGARDELRDIFKKQREEFERRRQRDR